MIYVAEHLTFEQKIDFQVGQFEHIWVDIKINKTIYTVNAWYRPPNEDNHDVFLAASNTILAKLQTYKAENKIIMSDLNYGKFYQARAKQNSFMVCFLAP